MDVKLILVVLLYILDSNVTKAARRIDAKERAKATMRKRDFNIKRATEEDSVSVNELLELTGDETMEVTRSAKTSQGLRVERLQEKYKGIEVFDSSVVVEIDKNGKLTGDASGTFIQGIEEDMTSTRTNISPEEAFDISIDVEGDRDIIDTIKNFESSLQIYLDEYDNARLVYFLQYMTTKNGIPKRPAFFIDANSGEVLLHWNNLDTIKCKDQIKMFGGNENMGRITYGEVPYCLDMNTKGDKCYLENKYVRVVDMMNTENSTINETISFVCSEGYNDTVNGAYSPAMDAFFYGTILGKMFEDWFQSTPLREKVILRVHYGNEFENAFWDGTTCNFGDGANTTFPLVSMDVVCHEVGHGVTEQSSSLFYFNQPGGLNEAFSDILGEACENYFQYNDFLVGQGLLKGNDRTYLRSFEHPSVDGHSIEHVNDYAELMNPHGSSGVFNRAFFVTIKQKGLELKQVAKVFYHANLMYWHHMSTFEDASCSVLKSAYDLGQKPTAYIRAFQDVGIEICDLSKHVRSLVNNKTYEDITVSVDSQPLFTFESPVWAESVLIDAKSSNGDVGIDYMVGSRNSTMHDFEDANYIKGNTNSVEIQDSANAIVLITLSSPSGELLDDVTLVVGYSCFDNFNATSGYLMYLYHNYCGLLD